jgi:hypothetical protein
VDEAKAGALASAGASESGARRPGRRTLGRSSQGCQVETEVRQAGGRRLRRGKRAEAEVRRVKARAPESWCGGQAVGAKVGSGKHAGRGDADLSRVRERGARAGACGIFLDKPISYVGRGWPMEVTLISVG